MEKKHHLILSGFIVGFFLLVIGVIMALKQFNFDIFLVKYILYLGTGLMSISAILSVLNPIKK